MLEALTSIYDWLFTGIYDFVIDTLAYLLKWLALFYIKFLSIVTSVSWDIAKSLIDQLSISTYLNQFVQLLDNRMVSFVAYCRGFDALLLVLNAKLTRYIMSIVGV